MFFFSFSILVRCHLQNIWRDEKKRIPFHIFFVFTAHSISGINVLLFFPLPLYISRTFDASVYPLFSSSSSQIFIHYFWWVNTYYLYSSFSLPSEPFCFLHYSLSINTRFIGHSSTEILLLLLLLLLLSPHNHFQLNSTSWLDHTAKKRLRVPRQLEAMLTRLASVLPLSAVCDTHLLHNKQYK